MCPVQQTNHSVPGRISGALDASGAAVDRHPARLKAIEKLIRQDLPAMEGHAFHSAAVASLQAAPCGFRSSGTVAQLRSEKS